MVSTGVVETIVIAVAGASTESPHGYVIVSTISRTLDMAYYTVIHIMRRILYFCLCIQEVQLFERHDPVTCKTYVLQFLSSMENCNSWS